jgi:hypothetical protein
MRCYPLVECLENRTLPGAGMFATALLAKPTPPASQRGPTAFFPAPAQGKVPPSKPNVADPEPDEKFFEERLVHYRHLHPQHEHEHPLHAGHEHAHTEEDDEEFNTSVDLAVEGAKKDENGQVSTSSAEIMATSPPGVIEVPPSWDSSESTPGSHQAVENLQQSFRVDVPADSLEKFVTHHRQGIHLSALINTGLCAMTPWWFQEHRRQGLILLS